MPRKTKEEIEEIKEKVDIVVKTKKPTNTKTAKKSSSKTDTVKKVSKKSSSKIDTVKKATKKASSKTDTVKKVAKKASSKTDTVKKVSKKASSKTDTVKKATKKASSKTDTVKKVAKKASSKTDTVKKVSKKASSKTDTVKKTVNKKASTKKVTTKKKSKASSKVLNNSTTKQTKKTKAKETRPKRKEKLPIEVLEYYDLPYRYNQTIVKILAQTPTTLFVYWDISDEDKTQFINKYGTYFFNNTKPVLVIHNKTMNYSFEVEINDFANSWYLSLQDSNCNYQVELGRRPINEYVELPNNYLYITNSNDYITQNDHILLDKLSNIIYFKNVKTNEIVAKQITNLTLLQRIGKFDIKKFYEKIYPDDLHNFEELHLGNPSSIMKNGDGSNFSFS